MSSIFTHGLTGAALAVIVEEAPSSKTVSIAAACALLPDADGIGYMLGIPYGAIFGHRGFLHSFTFAILVAGAVTLLLFREQQAFLHFTLFFAAVMSHGIQDAMTDGGLGVAFFSPFDKTRYFFRFRPLQVPPIDLRPFFTRYGMSVLRSEILWVWIPLSGAVLTVRGMRWILAAGLSQAVFAATPSGAVSFDGSIEIARGRGERGPWQQNESRYDYVDDPAVAIDDAGRISVAWVDQRRKDILFRRFSGTAPIGHGETINISRTPETFSWLPRIVLSPEKPDRIFILWQEIIFSGGSHGGEILFSRSEDGGKTFSAPLNLSNSIGGDGKGRIKREIWDNGSLDLAVDAEGGIFAAWTEYAGTLWLSRSTDSGQTFSTPLRVAGSDGAPARGPSLGIGQDGSVHLAWTVGDVSSADISIASSTDRGRSFGTHRIVARTPGYSDAPKLAADGKGVLHLVYAESDSGPFGRYQVYYTSSTDGGRSFAEPRKISIPAPMRRGRSFPLPCPRRERPDLCLVGNRPEATRTLPWAGLLRLDRQRKELHEACSCAA